MPAANTSRQIDFSAIPPGTIGTSWLHLIDDGLGQPLCIPLLIARGKYEGPVLGITAAIHGNELNGIPVIQQVFQQLDPQQLRGIVVGAPVMNVPGFFREERPFNDGTDLNRIAPGRPDGNVSQVYIYRLVERILRPLDLLIDLHTASFGRINSWYIRADLQQEQVRRMALLQNPEIILNNKAGDATFRGAATALGIPAVTLELRDPHIFQEDVIQDALIGIFNTLYDLEMLPGEISTSRDSTILCDDSYWLYTDTGGLLHIYPDVKQWVKRHDLLAELRDIFGRRLKTFAAPEPGIIIGKSVDPISSSGARLVHLGLRPQVMTLAK
ncbi:MAG: succinylglutamate desuccinylase/aspartoacylase family protein [Lewinellaceae bacterium]|nr:succinylglutamate desuccinylase/aspartoacylase family protein [Lewinellaceae bacterium]